jgi:hypothetical protein
MGVLRGQVHLEAQAMNELVLRGFSGVPEVTQEAWRLKREALAAAKPVARVETPEQQTYAVEALRKLKEVRTGLEASRKAVKAPVLDLGRKIDEIARDFGDDIERQYGRISGLINHYQRKLAAAKEEEDDKARSRATLAAQLREKATQLRAEATRLRERDPGSSPAHLKFLEADKLDAEAFDLEMSNEITAAPVVIDKPKGLVVKNKINFQVLDAIVFAQAWPQFWKISKNGDHDNECLTVDRMRVLDELNREDGKGVFHMTRFPEELSQTEDRRLVQPAGLRVYEETKAHVR